MDLSCDTLSIFFKGAVLSCLFLSLCTPCLLDANGSQEEGIDPLESASDMDAGN